MVCFYFSRNFSPKSLRLGFLTSLGESRILPFATPCIVTQSRLLIKQWSFGFIESSPLTRSKIHEKLFWFHTRVLFSAPRRSIILLVNYDSCWQHQNVGACTQAWQAKWAVFKIPGFVCKRFLPCFPTPSPLFYLCHFSPGLWLSFLVLCS